MFLRKLHLYFGFVLAPLILLQAVTGFLLKTKVSSELVHTLHTWFKYKYDFTSFAMTLGRVLGIAIAAGLVFLALTGGVLYVNMRVQQLRRWRQHRAAGQ